MPCAARRSTGCKPPCWACAKGQCVYRDCRLDEGATGLCAAWRVAARRSALQALQELHLEDSVFTVAVDQARQLTGLCVTRQVGAGRSALQAPQELLQLLQRGAGAPAPPRPPVQPEGQEGAGPHSFTCGVCPATEHPSAVCSGAWLLSLAVPTPCWRPPHSQHF